jgi:hypothetical protein
MQPFKEIKEINHELIAKECNNIIEQVGWNNCQICLQYSSEISWHNDVDAYGKTRIEHECINFHPNLEGTYLKEVLTTLDFTVASARLMFLHERSCYSTHVDLYTRYHIPIVNNSRLSFMVFPDIPFVAYMPKGKVYWTDTHQLHNFVNGDHEPRIHLIFNNANERENYSNPYLKELHGDRFE